MYDEEIILSFSDWYQTQTSILAKSFLSVNNPTGAEPVPDNALMNNTQNLQIKVQPGKTYLFRMVNIGAFANHRIWFEGHQMRVVEVDGVWTEPKDADMLYMAVAQRYSVLITMKNDTGTNFPITGAMDQVRHLFHKSSPLANIFRICLTPFPIPLTPTLLAGSFMTTRRICPVLRS